VRDFEPGGGPSMATRRALSATTRFYIGFALVLVIVVAASYGIGFRAGVQHAMHAAHAHAER